MIDHSFSFGGINSFEKYKIKATGYDVLKPEKRKRYQEIPFSSIPYNHGAKYYNQRIIPIHCTLLENITRAEFREISFWLDGQKRLVLWDEPDKYYNAEMFEDPEIIVFGHSATPLRQFTLNFICEPFAYGADVREKLVYGSNQVPYSGTHESPSVIIIKNIGTKDIDKIRITSITKEV